MPYMADTNILLRFISPFDPLSARKNKDKYGNTFKRNNKTVAIGRTEGN